MSKQTITTKALAKKVGLPLPNFVEKVADDFILVYDDEESLVCWGPETERDQVLAIAKVYE